MRPVIQTVLAGITASGNDEFAAGDWKNVKIECLKIFKPVFGKALENAGSQGTLERELRVIVRQVFDRDVESFPAPGYPLVVLILVRGVDDEKIMLVGEFINHQIINDAAVLFQHQSVNHFILPVAGDIVGYQIINETGRVLSGDLISICETSKGRTFPNGSRGDA